MEEAPISLIPDENSVVAAPSWERFALPLSIVLAAAIIGGSILYATSPSRYAVDLGGNDVPSPAPANQPAAVSAGDVSKIVGRDVVVGEENAPVTIIEYGDYQCPFCSLFFTAVEPKLREDYVKTGKAKMVYRNFAFLGPESFAAAESAECAKDQGKFWVYHDALFAAEHADGKEHNENLNRGLFVKLAKDVGMDVEKFAACVDSRQYQEAVKEETAAARTFGVNGTPATFINGTPISGVDPKDPLGEFVAAIEAALKKK